MSDIKQTIGDFYKAAQTRDFARQYQFRVLDVTNKGQSIFTQDDLVYATAATLPGKSISSVAAPYSGLEFKVPGTVQYNNSDGFSIDFYCDKEARARVAVENWITEIFNDANSVGDGKLHADSNITLAQLDDKFDVVRTYKLFGVWAKDCGDIAYVMTDNGNIATVTATFVYQFFRRDNEINQSLNLVGKLAG